MSAQTSRGFTLIELMVVISIIAILATVGLVVYSSAQKNARDGKRVGDLQEIQKALEQYYSINTQYPATLGSSLSSYFQGGSIPTDPNSGNYTYHACSTDAIPKHYVACANLENAKGNASAIPSDGCTGYTQSSGTNYYCVSQLSN